MDYESAKQFPLKRQENKAVKLDWRVEAIKVFWVGRTYSRAGSSAASPHHDFPTLSGIPAWVYDYRFGNRSALEWVIDQYRVTRHEQDNIVSDPNFRSTPHPDPLPVRGGEGKCKTNRLATSNTSSASSAKLSP